jgi:hypothetical protein
MSLELHIDRVNVPFDTFVVVSLPVNQVNNTSEVFFGANRNLNSCSSYPELLPDLVDDPPRVCTGPQYIEISQKRFEMTKFVLPVHLVDEGNARNIVSAHLTVNSRCLAL